MDTRIFSVPDSDAVSECGRLIREGGAVAFPTETVYGLGCNAFSAEGAKKVFAAKGRPGDNPLIVHICQASQLEEIAYPSDVAKKLADAFWPGPLTVIMPKKSCIPDEVTAGLDTVAVRFPSSETARALIEAAGVPVAAPSANLSGKPSPTKSSHVIDDLLGRVDAILCGEDCEVGLESTVVAVKGEGAVLCRPGKITPDDIRALGIELTVPENLNRTLEAGETAVSPGMKYKHYAPKAQLILLCGSGADKALEKYRDEGHGIICFDEDMPFLSGERTVSLGARDSSENHAKNLFSALRLFDEMNVEKIYSRLPKKDGVGLAVYNRILKAAGSRIEEV